MLPCLRVRELAARWRGGRRRSLRSDKTRHSPPQDIYTAAKDARQLDERSPSCTAPSDDQEAGVPARVAKDLVANTAPPGTRSGNLAGPRVRFGFNRARAGADSDSPLARKQCTAGHHDHD